MTYKELREQVLMLLHQYSVAGSPVEPLYNNQADDLVRIPAFLNEAAMEIATTVRKIPAVLDLSELPCEDLGRQLRFVLPENFYQFKSGDTVRSDDGRLLHTNCYLFHGRQCLVLPKEEAANCRITYYRYPWLLDREPDDAAVPDNAPETHTALCCYAAAMLAAHSDPWLCSLLMNRYDDKLRKLQATLSAEVHPVQDDYGLTGGGL